MIITVTMNPAIDRTVQLTELVPGQMHRFFEEPGRDMGAPCFTGAFTAFQIRVFSHHMFMKIILEFFHPLRSTHQSF